MGTLLTVCSFNLKHDGFLNRGNRWNTRRELVTRAIRASGASVIGVQELTPPMREDLLANLKEYRIYGTGRSRMGRGEYSAVILRNSDFEVRYYDTFWLSRHPDVQGSRAPFSPFPRVCTVCEAYCRKWGCPVRIFNTHLCHLNPAARMLSVRVILRFMQYVDQKEKMPTILMGDMNARPSSRPIRYLSQNPDGGPHLTPVFPGGQGRGPDGTYHGFHGGEHGRTIDYIFVTDDIRVVRAYVDASNEKGKYPSDHYPLVAELQLGP